MAEPSVDRPTGRLVDRSTGWSASRVLRALHADHVSPRLPVPDRTTTRPLDGSIDRSIDRPRAGAFAWSAGFPWGRVRAHRTRTWANE